MASGRLFQVRGPAMAIGERPVTKWSLRTRHVELPTVIPGRRSTLGWQNSARPTVRGVCLTLWQFNFKFKLSLFHSAFYTTMLLYLTYQTRPCNMIQFENSLLYPQFLGAEKTGEAVWVNNLPKVTTSKTVVAGPGCEPRTSWPECQRVNHTIRHWACLLFS